MRTNQTSYKLKIFLLCSLMACGLSLVTSCSDDDLKLDEDRENQQVSSDGFVLSFDVKVDVDPATRGWDVNYLSPHSDAENYETYIDTQDKFRVFFFTEGGDFIFGAIDRTISHGSINDDNTQTYTVRIPMNLLVDREGYEYDVEAIKDYLKNNSFKVAVLANWPNAGEKINPGDYDDGDSTNDFGQNPSSVLKGQPLWGLKNSILYNGDDSDLKNINDLHHLFDESNIYASETLSGSRTITNRQCYEPFMKLVDVNGQQVYAMGEPTDWVQMRDVSHGWVASAGWTDSKGVRHNGYSRKSYALDFDSKESANKWIRANWNPDVELNNQKGIYRHYQNLWYLWNFDASYKYGLYKDNPTDHANYQNAYISNFGWNNGYEGAANTWGAQWFERNGEKFYDWMKVSSSNAPLENLHIVTGTGQNDSFFMYQSYTSTRQSYRVHNPASVYNNYTDYYGIKLPSRGTGSQVGNTSEGVLSFQARTSGTIRVKWGNGNDHQEAKIRIQKGTTILKEYTIAAGNRYKLFDLGGSNSEDEFLDISMGADATPIYIYCIGGDAIIYAIEYIRGKYLFETDREGVVPSREQGIPMYAVQNFGPIQDWPEGSTKVIEPKPKNEEIDPDTPGEFKLLRALAKVEVYIPTKFGRPRHIYMRGMNRAARCEPMNVFDPVNWEEQPQNSPVHPDNCEFFNLISYRSCFNPDSGSLSEYQNWLSWFYGSWERWNFFTENKLVNIPAAGNNGYPQIFNPYINRSDFCHLIFMGEDGEGNYKYILYMPEKFIDDPRLPGLRNSTPVVPHIEYRFTPGSINNEDDREETLTHSEFNLEDSNCYRIYFTNYGSSDNGYGEPNPVIRNVYGSSYDNYEANAVNLGYHWPIMRNHKYRFYVSGSSPETAVLKVKITDWTHEKVVVEW